MWKKQDDSIGRPPEFGSKPMPESPSELDEESQIEAFVDGPSEKGSPAAGPQRVVAEVQPPSMPPSMAAYTEAVHEFTRSATAFIEYVPLLTRARDAYDRAMKASAEVRRVLDKGEEDLRALMNHLAQVLNSNLVKPPDKKRPELAKVEVIKDSEADSSGMKAFP